MFDKKKPLEENLETPESEIVVTIEELPPHIKTLWKQLVEAIDNRKVAETKALFEKMLDYYDEIDREAPDDFGYQMGRLTLLELELENPGKEKAIVAKYYIKAMGSALRGILWKEIGELKETPQWDTILPIQNLPDIIKFHFAKFEEATNLGQIENAETELKTVVQFYIDARKEFPDDLLVPFGKFLVIKNPPKISGNFGS